MEVGQLHRSVVKKMADQDCRKRRRDNLGAELLVLYKILT